jgi:ATP-binding cassette subfamily B protein/subfamily B ATP-binding cassette protein MsbA
MQKYKRLLHYAGPQRWRLVLILVLSLTASALLALQLWPIKLLVDHLLGSKPIPPWLAAAFRASPFTPTPLALLVLVTSSVLALIVCGSLLEAALACAWTLAGRRMVYDLAEDLFARLQHRSLLFHRRLRIGDTMGCVTVDCWSVYHLVDTVFMAPSRALLTMAAIVFLIAPLDLTLTGLSLAMGPLIVASSLFAGKPLRAAAQWKRGIETRLQSHLQQTLTGIPVVQAFAQEERESERLRQFADAAIRIQQRTALIGSVNSLSSGLAATVGTGIILWVGARHVLAGQLTIGGLLVFLAYLALMQTQMKSFANIYTALQGFSASVDRVLDSLETESDVTEPPGAIPLSAVRGRIQIERVTFGYEPGRPVLRDVSLEILPGKIVAVVGPSGAGKTTLLNLVPRHFDPWAGRVLVEGKDVREVRMRSLRDQIAVVPQETFLFPLSVADNIAFGRPDASRAEVEAAARVAHAHDFILRLPQGYDTIPGERGATLSGGERQRLSIARALLKNAPILLLDEPTSALDAESEALVVDSLSKLMRSRTTLMVAHRLTTIGRVCAATSRMTRYTT